MSVNTHPGDDTQSEPVAAVAVTHDSSERLLWLALGATLISSFAAAGVGMTVGFHGVFWGILAVHYVALISCNVAAFRWLTCLFMKPWARWVAGFSLLTGLLFLGRLASFPVTATDALVHHLAVPKWWLADGRIHNIMWHEWSFYPMAVNIGFLLPLHWNFPRFAALYHLAYWLPLGAFTGMLAVSVSQKIQHARLAAFVAVTLPLFLRLASVPLVDLGLTVFCTAALVLVTRMLEGHQGFVAPLLGLTLGGALSSKLNGILFVAMLSVGWIVTSSASRKMFRGGVSQLTLALILAGIFFSPWGGKNFLDTGNPVFPLYRGLLGGPSLNLLDAPVGVHPLVHRQEIYGESSLDLLLLPLRMVFGGEDNNPRKFDGVLTPLFFLAFLPLFQRQKSRALTFNLLVTVFYVVAALMVSGARARYLCPILPSVCVLSGYALTAWGTDRWIRYAPQIAVIVHSFWSGSYALQLTKDRGSWPPVGNDVAETQYLMIRLADYGLIQYTNTHLAPTDRAYLVGTPNRFFLFDRPILSRGYYSANEIISWVRSGSQPDEIAQRLADLNVTHLFVGTDRLKELFAQLLTPQQGEVWNTFSREHLELVHVGGAYSLWRLRR
jgi:hypothetical protein